MKNFFLFTKNINNYGIWTFLNIIFFEIKFFFETNNINSLNHDSEFTSDYNETKTKKNYNTPYIPTSYYFFHIIKNILKIKNLNNFTFIDFGCGYSRSLFFLKKFFNLKFIGIDLNKKIIKKMQNFKSHKSFFFEGLRSDIENELGHLFGEGVCSFLLFEDKHINTPLRI